MRIFGLLSILLLIAATGETGEGGSPFVGTWALGDDTCGNATNWSLNPDGSFTSENLSGSWSVAADRLSLNLVDLLPDEFTGETGEKFRLDGPYAWKSDDVLVLTVEPETYTLKRCG